MKLLYQYILIFVLIGFCKPSTAQFYKGGIEKHSLFGFSIGPTYLYDDQNPGIFGQFHFPTQNGIAFFTNALVLIPEKEKYEEYRMEMGFELVFLKLGNFHFSGNFGQNWGWWKYNYKLPDSEGDGVPFDRRRFDTSYFVGGGIEFRKMRHAFFVNSKVYPEIFSVYIETGYRINILRKDFKKGGKRRRSGIK